MEVQVSERNMSTRLADLKAKAKLNFPGVLASLTVGTAATFLSDHYGGPTMLYALLLGMAFYFLSQEGSCVAGIATASRTILRIGVGLLGMRITTDQIMGLGVETLILVVCAVAFTILSGWVAARFLGLDKDFGFLTGGAVGVCGASAALAIAAVLPKHERHEQNTIFTVITVTALSTIAMIVYPMIVQMFNLGPVSAGIFLGGTIHDVAQVAGAGYSMSTKVGDTAIIVKLMRVAMLLPAVMVISMYFSRETAKATADGQRPPLLPTFLIAFAVLVGINSTGIVPHAITVGINDLSRWCLVTAISALGMKTSLQAMAKFGWRPIMLMVIETVFMVVMVMSVILIQGGTSM